MRPRAGLTKGFVKGEKFVIMGDQNVDPNDGDCTNDAIHQLTGSSRVNTSVTPASEGGVEAAALQGGANDDHRGDPAFDTSDSGDEPEAGGPGNLRVDYVLPAINLEITDAGVFWPTSDGPLSELVSSSDHRLVWVDLKVR